MLFAFPRERNKMFAVGRRFRDLLFEKSQSSRVVKTGSLSWDTVLLGIEKAGAFAYTLSRRNYRLRLGLLHF